MGTHGGEACLPPRLGSGEVAQEQERDLRQETNSMSKWAGPLDKRLEGKNHTMLTGCGL